MLGDVPKSRKVPKEEYLGEGATPCIDQSKEVVGGFTDDPDARFDQDLPVTLFGDHTRVVKYIDFPFARGADGTQILIPRDGDMPRTFFHFLIDAVDLSNYFYARHMKFLKATEVLVPTKELKSVFDEIAQPAMRQVSLLHQQNRTLARARDLLLPRLMDGRVSV